MRGLKKIAWEGDIKQTHKRTCRLSDQLGPEGRVGEKVSFAYQPSSFLYRVLPVICLLIYMFGFGAGSGPLQWVFMGELLPPDYKVWQRFIRLIHRSLQGAVWDGRVHMYSRNVHRSASLTRFTSNVVILVTKIFPTLVDSSIGASAAYWSVG